MSGEHDADTGQTLVARCRSCGGPVPLTLVGPPPACRHCDASEPLEPGTSQTLARMRARFEQRGATQLSLTGKLVSAATGLQGMAFALGITMWLLFGGMALVLALEHTVPLPAFVGGQTRGGELNLEWWVLWSVAAGLPLSIFAFGLSLARLRALALASVPLAPAFPGAPPRCRACAGELPPGTAIRRCLHCRSDNLMTGGRYQASARELDRALTASAARFEADLARRIALADTVLTWATMLPIGVLLIVPIVGLFLTPIPRLWILVPILWAGALLSLGLAARRKLAKVEALECLSLGSEVLVDGVRMEVRAQLFVPRDSGALRVESLIGPEHLEPRFAYHLETGGPRWKESVWELGRGGAPLEEEELGRLTRIELRRPASSSGSGLRVDALGELSSGGERRLWLREGLVAGASPLWTLRAREDTLSVVEGD